MLLIAVWKEVKRVKDLGGKLGRRTVKVYDSCEQMMQASQIAREEANDVKETAKV